MDAQQIRDAFDDVFDQALLYHGFADHMRDYDVFVYATADPRTGIRPTHLRYRFTHCVRATTTTSLSPETWANSVDDRLLGHDTGHDLDGYVWGVRWQVLYPGMRLLPPTPETRDWWARLGIPFHEARIEANGHTISLTFSNLVVERVEPGLAPFTVTDD